MSPEPEPTAKEDREVQVAQTKRGQKWFAHVTGTVGTVVMLAIAARYITGLFGMWDHEALTLSEIGLGMAIGFGSMLGSTAFAQVALGMVGVGILTGFFNRFRRGGGGG